MKISRIVIIVVLSAVVIVSSIAIFFVWRNLNRTDIKQNSQGVGQSSKQDSSISLDEVAKHTGKNGNSCWVAVDGIVYEISGFVLWVEGEHKPSGGRAKCGKDLSEAIQQSPHGKSKLKLLKEIGPLQQ